MGKGLMFWGHSAGGQFAFGFACWRPERTVAWVAIKGGYYREQPSQRFRQVPGLVFAGENDTEERMTNITAMWEENRRRGGYIAMAVEPDAGHGVGDTHELAIPFLETILDARLPKVDGSDFFQRATSTNGLQPMPTEEVWLGDPDSGEVYRESNFPGASRRAVWLPNEEVALLWAEFVSR